MREVREPKPSKVGPWWLLAQHSVVLLCGFSALAAAMRSLLLPNCEGLHSVRLYRAANRHAVIFYSHWSIHRSVAASIFQSTNDIRIQNAESNSPIFASLWRGDSTWSTYFVATILITQCVSLQYLSTALTACCLFQTERSYHGKTVKCAIFQVFALGSCKLFIKSYVLCFFLHFFISCDGPRYSVRN